ncbi:uncharacterized protein TRUGW13939_11183 [Talaromyces rugulosus]|uniref:ABM domain-containing protein n=1 Tax=Talaromyces rugulosus TaxID=121627 RepID=A0A7H8RC32_TALRU|nr:uncharacterized protein TRUGW13939_11183 [Talaromyces rugulosus]QKX64010.1 hypothetical protein TRUGW13939_11183 [Talaromyces rugulosus]
MADDLLHLVATITVKDGKLEQVLEALKTLASTVHQTEPDVLRYFAFQTKNSEGQDQLVMIEKYSNAEAHKAHSATSHFKSFVGQVQDLLAGPLDIKVGPLVAGYESKSKASL